MADGTNIEWTDASWQATHGCSIVSPGCTNCYAMKMAARLEAMGQAAYTGLTQQTKAGAVWNGVARQASQHALTQPLRWKKPRRIFVDSMADLFAEGVEDADIDQVFAVIALCPQHTFQCLTKRPERMREYIVDRSRQTPTFNGMASICAAIEAVGGGAMIPSELRKRWPLPNVMLGTSVEDQQRADERIPHLLATPGAVRFLSCEPLLGPVDLQWALSRNALDIAAGFLARGHFTPGLETIRHLDWVIVGGESGPRRRPFDPEWARSIRDQCAAGGVAFFGKQHDKVIPLPDDLMIRQHPSREVGR